MSAEQVIRDIALSADEVLGRVCCGHMLCASTASRMFTPIQESVDLQQAIKRTVERQNAEQHTDKHTDKDVLVCKK